MPLRISPTQMAFARTGGPPAFRIETDGDLYFAVQVTTIAILFNGANASRRAAANWFDSWVGDTVFTGAKVPITNPIPGEQLEAPTGKATYALPSRVWDRLKSADQLFYRAVVADDVKRRRHRVSLEDGAWAKAPSVSIGSVPARRRGAVAAFPGKGALGRTDFLAEARRQLDMKGSSGVIHGRDGDYRFAVLDARLFDMAVLECHEFGLTDTVEKMPRKPDAIINAQFISAVVGVGTEGQVVREGLLINADSASDRQYLSQTWNASGAGAFHFGKGNPATLEPNARVAFGGLGPVLINSAAVGPTSRWAKDIFDRDSSVGRGIIGLDRPRGLILLIVQENDASGPGTVGMRKLRDRLIVMGLTDAVFNDGSDSESLFAGGNWLLKPGYLKNEAMDFAIAFVRRPDNQRIASLAIDGTKTADAETFAEGISRPLTTHYRPRNIVDELKVTPAMAPVASLFDAGIVKAWKTNTNAERLIVADLFANAGAAGRYGRILYLGSHAWRHGQLWYHYHDIDPGGASQMIADLWSPAAFSPTWVTTPSWIVIAGCAVLGLHYSRFVALTAIERGHLLDWHRDMYGATATLPALTSAKKSLFAVYHPGWAWHARVFSKSKSLRGVLGYWHRSPGAEVGDVDLITDFTKRLRQGETMLSAWEATNKRAFYQAAAPWAAMIRSGCEDDSLGTLENPTLAGAADFRYYDRYQRSKPLDDAYRFANTPDNATTVGTARVHHNSTYDRLAITEGNALSPAPTGPTVLIYSDGMGPPPLKPRR
jgi:hypothetical protein